MRNGNENVCPAEEQRLNKRLRPPTIPPAIKNNTVQALSGSQYLFRTQFKNTLAFTAQNEGTSYLIQTSTELNERAQLISQRIAQRKS